MYNCCHCLRGQCGLKYLRRAFPLPGVIVTACEGSVDRNEVMSNGKPEITVTACEAVWFESIVKSHNT